MISFIGLGNPGDKYQNTKHNAGFWVLDELSRRWKTVFKPGYTTRQRGWGLGLSLAKRIIEEYHKGKIYVKESKLGAGTRFRIELKS